MLNLVRSCWYFYNNQEKCKEYECLSLHVLTAWEVVEKRFFQRSLNQISEALNQPESLKLKMCLNTSLVALIVCLLRNTLCDKVGRMYFP